MYRSGQDEMSQKFSPAVFTLMAIKKEADDMEATINKFRDEKNNLRKWNSSIKKQADHAEDELLKAYFILLDAPSTRRGENDVLIGQMLKHLFEKDISLFGEVTKHFGKVYGADV